MNKTITRLERLHSEVEQHSFLHLASEGLLSFSDGAEALTDRLDLNMGATQEFMHGQGVAEGMFARPLIAIESPADLGSSRGSLIAKPVIFQKEVYYPYIKLVVNPDKPEIDRVNNTFRHELRHVLQPDVLPLYGRRKARKMARTVGGVTLGPAILGTLDIICNPETLADTPLFALPAVALGCGILTCFSSLAIIKPRQALYMLSLREADANRFARRHQDFNPITLNA